jgi:DNA-binding NtrC family response regulator
VKKILVVDDEANIRRLYTDELTDSGYTVVSAADWEQARRALDSERFDLVTLDIRMGEGPDGIEALRMIKELHPGLPVVLVTAYGEYQADFGSWAAEGYVVKSSDLSELKRRIAEELGETPV